MSYGKLEEEKRRSRDLAIPASKLASAKLVAEGWDQRRFRGGGTGQDSGFAESVFSWHLASGAEHHGADDGQCGAGAETEEDQ
jgi:hypothetical protein